jgi:phosphodiesterase/alkaline phosphatase D-like protein
MLEINMYLGIHRASGQPNVVGRKSKSRRKGGGDKQQSHRRRSRRFEQLERRDLMAVIAGQDFDGGEVNLISDTVVNLDGGAGDFIGVGNRNAWPQGFPSPGLPFSLADDSVVGVSNGGAPFAADAEGIFGQNADFSNDFFSLSDTREWTAAQRTVTWTFDINGIFNPQLSIDMGGISDAASGGYSATTDVKFLGQIDGQPVQTAFDLDAIARPAGFTSRPMDDGDPSGGGRVLIVNGPNGVIKRRAEDGSVDSNTILDKSPAAGFAAGRLDTYTTSLIGSGSVLTLTMIADVPFEAMAFDNILISAGAATDSTPPGLSSLTPADNANSVAINSNLVVGFNELVQAGTGTITIFRASDNSAVEVIDIQDTVVAGAGVTVNPSADLEYETSYYVQISVGAIEDLAGNQFAGISDANTWNFTTIEAPDLTPPALVATGPFAVSENAQGGTIVGDINADDGDGADVGVRYAFVNGSGADTSMMVGLPGYAVTPLFTVGQTISGTTGALNSTTAGDYDPMGVLDGIGAYELNATTVRAFVNHEVGPSVGYSYSLENGLTLTGARISYFDIDKVSRTIVDSGLAYGTVYDRAGNVVTSVTQLDTAGFDRFCSGSLFEANSFGPGRGIVDTIFFAGEEASTDFSHPFGGTEWALDVTTGALWALPDFGRGSWENVAQLDTGTTTHVAFLMGDDAEGRPLWMYVGEKSSAPGASFLERNGLTGGKLYYWKSNTGEINADQFNATENGAFASLSGTWVEFIARDVALAGTPGYDLQGYKNDVVTLQDVVAGGGFQFSRPEDLSTNPANGAEVVFASTGRANFANNADRVGTVYRVNIDFSNLGAPTGSLTILYDGDADPSQTLRSPDNLDWADDGFVYVQEDDAVAGLFGGNAVNPNEASIVRLDPSTGAATRIAQIDRSSVLPLSTTDGSPTDVGNWESSGILDVSKLFGEAPGSLMLFDVQAHAIRNGIIAANGLAEGGQLSLLEVGGEAGAFRINRNTGIVTVANPSALPIADGAFELTVQAIDASGNTSFATVKIDVNRTPVAANTDVRFATFNASLNRNTAGELVADLLTPDDPQAKKAAEIIQRTNPDVLLVNEFDFDASGRAADLFRENYLEISQNGAEPVYYPFVYVAPSNTGVPSGFDLNNNGTIGGGDDAYGFGDFPGQFAMVLFSKYEIVTEDVRTFQRFLWKDMPGALLPDDASTAAPNDWYSPEELGAFRLSSKSHWDVPINVNGTVIHALVSHPTPPVFDGVEDRNGKRNHDEIRFWADYVTPEAGSYIYDDIEFAAAGNTTPSAAGGGLPAGERFVIMGDNNADPLDGDSVANAANLFLTNAYINTAVTPSSVGGIENADVGQLGNPAFDTSDFGNPPGNLRVDYVLPSKNLDILDAAVFWPAAADPLSALVSASDHRLVWVDVAIDAPEVLIASGETRQHSTVLLAKATTPGALTFEVASDAEFSSVLVSDVHAVTDVAIPAKSFIVGLDSNTTYWYRATDAAGRMATGRFKTAASAADGQVGLTFGVSGDWRGELAPYPAVANADDANLDFFVSLGDTIYADFASPDVPLPQAMTIEQYRAKQNEVYSSRFGQNTLGDLRASTSVFATIDDHEVINDFAGGAEASSDPRFAETEGLINQTQLYRNGLQAFEEYNPIEASPYSGTGDPRFEGVPELYEEQSFGLDAAIFVLDARSFRDQELPGVADLADPAQVGSFLTASFNPDRTMLGATQIDDLKQGLLEAEANGQTWKFIFVPEPIQNLGVVGASDRFEGYAAERAEILEFVHENGIVNVVFVAADIHGTLVNNLTYQTTPFGPQIATGAFEISTGSVAFDAPFGPTVAQLAAAAGLLNPQQLAFYNSLPIASDPDSVPNDKDDFLKSVIDGQLALLGYDPIGLNNNLASASGLIDATLLQGDYIATHTFGWTEFSIDAQTQKLLVTTWGIAPYTEAELLADPAAILARAPIVVSQFEVNPQAGPQAFAMQDGTTLKIGGTNGDDVILVERGRGHEIVVTVNGAELGVFDRRKIELITADGLVGNDTITVSPQLRTKAILRGSAGDDNLYAGSGDNVVLGGLGRDAIFGGLGRDLLIGGRGEDVLVGGLGEDLLIGGETEYDDQDAQLLAILSNWNGVGSYWQRIDRLRKGNGAPILDNSTVSDDEERDKLFGGLNRDFFFDGLLDELDNSLHELVA